MFKSPYLSFSLAWPDYYHSPTTKVPMSPGVSVSPIPQFHRLLLQYDPMLLPKSVTEDQDHTSGWIVRIVGRASMEHICGSPL